jgi:alpha-1,2-mannosyltransferase
VSSGRAGLVVLGALLAALAWHSATHAIDFPVYHRAATQVLAGDYELYPRAIYEGDAQVPGHAFRYAPALAFLFAPFGLLPLPAAAFAFFCLKIPALVYIFTVVTRRLDLESRRGRLMAITMLIVGGYLVEELRNGNFHFFAVFLMVVAFDLAERGRVLVPAAALALAIAAKLLPAVLLGYFLIRRRYAVSVATVVAVVILWLLPAASIGVEANNRLHQGFLRFALQKADEQANHSLRGTLFRYLTRNELDDPRNPDANLVNLAPPTVDALALAFGLSGAAILVAALWRKPGTPEGTLLDLALIMVAVLIGSPHTQRIYFSALVVPVAVLVALLMRHPRLPGRALPLVALGLTAAVATVLPLVLSTRRWAVAFEALSPHFFASAAIGIALLVLVFRFGAGKQTVRAPVS